MLNIDYLFILLCSFFVYCLNYSIDYQFDSNCKKRAEGTTNFGVACYNSLQLNFLTSQTVPIPLIDMHIDMYPISRCVSSDVPISTGGLYLTALFMISTS